MTIKSLPAPCHIQWSANTKDDNSFTPIDTNAEEYKETTVSFPNSVFVVRQRDQPEEKCYQIEVLNFIGKTVQDILETISSFMDHQGDVFNIDRELSFVVSMECPFVDFNFRGTLLSKVKF